MEKTAVDWLVEQFNLQAYIPLNIEQAKQMEKQQIINAFHKQSQKFYCEEEAEQYYNETFKSE